MSWESHLHLVEFAYNNSCYHSTIEVAPYRHYTTYGRKCRSPVGEKKLLGPDLVQEADEKVEMIRKRLLTTQSRQKCYAEGRDLEKKEGDRVFLSSLPPGCALDK